MGLVFLPEWGLRNGQGWFHNPGGIAEGLFYSHLHVILDHQPIENVAFRAGAHEMFISYSHFYSHFCFLWNSKIENNLIFMVFCEVGSA
jgi:hypothetical protein